MPKVAQPPADTPTPFWSAPGGETTMWHGHVLDVLRRLPSRSVHCCVTSPPYWGLRSYSTGDGKHQEIGCEATPEEFIAAMVEVFGEVRRVLRKDGTLWLNLGDTYGGGPPGGAGKQHTNVGSLGCTRGTGGLPKGNLCGIPWRAAFALQAAGWVLRSDVPWCKRSAMPESCTNRPGKSLEYFFMLTQGMDYYFDMEAVRVGNSTPHRRGGVHEPLGGPMDRNGHSQYDAVEQDRLWGSGGRNFRNTDLWFESVDGPHGMTGVGDELVGLDVVGQSYSGSHFATFGTNLITPLIRASTSEYGCCEKCGAPYYRVLDKCGPAGLTGGSYAPPGQAAHSNARGRGGNEGVARNRNGVTGSLDGELGTTTTVGWSQSCSCNAGVVGCVVLDPFVGSGTTPATCITLGRRGIGIDLSEEYLREHAVPRCEAAIATGKVVRQLVKVEPAAAAEVARPKVVRFGADE